MAISHKYRTFDQLLEDVSIDFSSYALEGMIEPQQLIKVAIRVNYDLGLKINSTKELLVHIEHSKGKLPKDFKYLNYAYVCGEYKKVSTPPSGTHVDTTNPKYVPSPDDLGPCTDPTCSKVCVVQTGCDKPNQEEYMLIQYVGAEQYNTYTQFFPLKIIDKVGATVCDCPNINQQAVDKAEIKDVYINYQGAMENEEGDLLVLDHPYCNEYYEYALKQRILENMAMNGEQGAAQQLNLIEQRLRAARNNALGFVNTPDFAEYKKMWEVNRRAQYHNYYNMFKSHPTVR